VPHRVRHALRALLVVVALAATPGLARAESIDFLGLGKNAIVVVNGPISGAVYAGELNWAWLGTPPGEFGQTFYSYCVDILQALVDPQEVTIRAASDLIQAPDGGAKAAWLLNAFAPGIHATGTGIQAAALQVAIWEALYDSSASLTSGVFSLASSTSSAIVTQAQVYLSALYSAPGGYHTSNAIWIDTDRGQDQITLRVPEPATIVLLGFGLAAGWRFRRINPSVDVLNGRNP
jgi:hypothetical protein